MLRKKKNLWGLCTSLDFKGFRPVQSALKERRRSELVKALCESYVGRERIFERSVGLLLPAEATARLLDLLRSINFEENVRPSVQAKGYITLKAAQAEKFADSWGEQKSLGQLWLLAETLLRGASSKAQDFHFTALAVTKNFRGSPHVDQNDSWVELGVSFLCIFQLFSEVFF